MVKWELITMFVHSPNKKVLFKALTHSGPRYADPLPVLRHWQLVLKYFRY